MNHYRKTLQQYLSHQEQKDCPFCRPETVERAVFSDDFVYVVPNITFYDLWEMHDVEEHVMIIPKRHVETLKDLTDEEQLAIMHIAADYESQGYCVYARGVGFSERSVAHQHTHLIKAANTRARFSLYIKKPYVLIKK